MKKQIQNYIQKITNLLMNNEKIIDWKQVEKEYNVKLSFFQHERLIHLLVLITTIISIVIATGIFIISNYNYIFILMIMIAILLIPYTLHYYFLENSIQKLYLIYDQIIEKNK